MGKHHAISIFNISKKHFNNDNIGWSSRELSFNLRSNLNICGFSLNYIETLIFFIFNDIQINSTFFLEWDYLIFNYERVLSDRHNPPNT